MVTVQDIIKDCRDAAHTYKGFDRPVEPASVVAIYERIAASLEHVLAQCALDDAAEWCMVERDKLGAVDGYDYRSGEEFGLRRAEIELRRRAKAAVTSTECGDGK